MSVPRIELFETELGLFTVICGERFADHLGRDEALAVVAAALFCGTPGPPFLKTYQQWDAWDRKYRSDQHRAPVALLTMRTTS